MAKKETAAKSDVCKSISRLEFLPPLTTVESYVVEGQRIEDISLWFWVYDAHGKGKGKTRLRLSVAEAQALHTDLGHVLAVAKKLEWEGLSEGE